PGLTVDGGERFLCVIPFFHSFAMTGLMNFAIKKAGQMLMLPRFEPKQALKVKRDFERASGCKLVEGYGLSETSPVTHINPVGGDPKEGSIGLPLPRTIISLRELGAPEREAPL